MKNTTPKMKRFRDSPPGLLSSKEMSDHFNISKSTLTRWIKRGCPYHKQLGYQHRLLFELNRTLEWLDSEGPPEMENKRRPRTLHRLKLYHVVDGSCMYQGIVYGSRMLMQRLRSFGLCDRHYPYGVDINGYIYIFYSGKLRRLESVKSAAVLIDTGSPNGLNALWEILHDRYLKKKITKISS